MESATYADIALPQTNAYHAAGIGSEQLRSPSNIERLLVYLAMKIHILFISCKVLGSPVKIWRTYRKIIQTRNAIWGGPMTKLQKVNGKYYSQSYSVPWPSKLYTRYIKSELGRLTSTNLSAEKPSFVFFAITRKCPMRCEHCFEWDNLNQAETFTKTELLKIVEFYQQHGVLQFHFSGGEPMVRIKDLVDVIGYASKQSACWVLTSGFNLTRQNNRLLADAGCSGVVVSIDHYVPELHNAFRGHANAFEHAVNAIRHAKQAGLATAISVCATKQFLNGGHLLPYIEFAKSLGVNFVQVLEPRNIGHYSGKDVLLGEDHILLLEQTFKTINHSKAYRLYPTLLYHGFHQRRIGCFSGSRSVYIDSAGYVNSCPFCHTKLYNILDVIRKPGTAMPQKENVCPLFEKIA